MNDSLRRIIIFCVMVGTGTLLIFYDLPLLFILPLVAALGFLLLILASPVPVEEMKSALLTLHKISFIRRHRETKTPIKMAEPAPAEAKKQEPAPIIKERKRGLPLHIHSIVSSFKALGTFLTARKKTERKNVDEIDKLLDQMISDKVNLSDHKFNANMMKESGMPTAMPTGGGAGGDFPIQPPAARPEDPFLSLSSDELETGLLDSMDEDERAGAAPVSGDDARAAGAPADTASAGLPISEPDMPIPPQDVSSEAGEIPGADEPGPDEYSPLEGTDTMEEHLGELDTAGAGDAEFDEDFVDDKRDAAASAPSARPGGGGEVAEPAALAVQQASPGAAPAPAPAAPPPATAPALGPAPADPVDMTAFTAVTGSDNDMLNTLAGDAKTAKKTQNVSLLRELRDFQEPAKEIESELTEIYAALNTTRKRKTKPS